MKLTVIKRGKKKTQAKGEDFTNGHNPGVIRDHI